MQFQSITIRPSRARTLRESLSTKTAAGLPPSHRTIFRRAACKQIFLVMRITFMLILAAILQSSAKSSAQTVTYTGKPATLGQMFRVIRQQTDYRVFYRAEDLDSTARVHVQFTDAPRQPAL